MGLLVIRGDDLSEEDQAKLEAAMASDDHERIENCINELLEKEAKPADPLLDALTAAIKALKSVKEQRDSADRARLAMISQFVLNIHHCAHTDQMERAAPLLCVMASIIDGQRPEPEVLSEFIAEQQKLHSERAKHECAGNA